MIKPLELCGPTQQGKMCLLTGGIQMSTSVQQGPEREQNQDGPTSESVKQAKTSQAALILSSPV
jgi:hypothetical protein